MVDRRTAAFGALLLRVSLVIVLLAHASLKILVATPAGAAGSFRSLGLASELAQVVIAAEALGGGALVLGIWSRLAALLPTPSCSAQPSRSIGRPAGCSAIRRAVVGDTSPSGSSAS